MWQKRHGEVVEGHEEVVAAKGDLDRKLRRSNSSLQDAEETIKVRILTSRHASIAAMLRACCFLLCAVASPWCWHAVWGMSKVHAEYKPPLAPILHSAH